ncbi:MAG: hypothetical protein JNM17_04125 [Archangium sp.]|nr:hypothetical protein [Archangium sp.]
MSANPVNAWDMLALLATETTLGVTPAPANQAAMAALAVQCISCTTGPAESGVVRPMQDRAPGRDMQTAFVEGRVMPIPWTFDASLKTRAAVDTASPLLPLLKAAGLVHTINGGSNVTITHPGQPIEGGAFAGMSLYRYLGSGLATHQAEVLRGCVARSLRIEGGNSEVLAKFAGVGMGKTTASGQSGVLGRIDSITLANGAVTTLTITAEESYRLGLGYYLVESEVIQVTACTPGSTSATIARGALGTAAAGHTAQPLVPYRPTPTFTGSPIAEPVSTVTLGGVATRCRSWSVDLTTGMDLLEPETGSRYSQGAKYTRIDAKVQLQLVLSADLVSMMGKGTARPNLALALSQGSGAGGVFTLNAPNTEIVGFDAPDTPGDVAIADVSLRLRGGTGAGNDTWNIVLT